MDRRIQSLIALAFLLVSFFSINPVYAATKKPHVQPPPVIAESPQLQQCLKRADDLPDIAAAEATAWIKKGGGNDAHLCRAFAQMNRGMHEDAAKDFWVLASYYDKFDAHHAVLMHDMAGQEFLATNKIKDALAQYGMALNIAPKDPQSLIGRAKTRMAVDRYWDALDDLNKALKIDPNNVDALRQRGRAWAQLGDNKNAQEDFGRAEDLATSETKK